MRVISLHVENFMGLAGTHDLALDGLRLVHVAGRNLDDPGNDSNGSGKTTILEALTWGLFGEGLPRPQGNSERGVQADEVLNDRVGKGCRVRVDLQDGDRRYAVERWRKCSDGSGVALYVDGARDQALDERETTARISQALGTDYAIWSRAVVFGQEASFNFCEATPLQRQEILSTVMGLEEIDRWVAACREERKERQLARATAEGALATRQTQLAEESRVQYTEQIQRWDADHAARLAALETRKSVVMLEGESAKARLQECPDPGPEDHPPATGAPVEQAAVQDARSRWQGSTERLSRARGELTVARGELARLARDRKSLTDLYAAAVCPTCRQPITRDHQAACLAELDARALEVTHHAEALAAGEAAASQQEAADRELCSRVDRALAEAQQRAQEAYQAWSRRSAEVRAQRERRAHLGAELQRLRAEWVRLDLERVRVADEANPYQAVADQQAEKVAMLRAAVGELSERLAGIDHELAICQWWDRELPRFRTWLFDAIVDTLAAEANRWLSIMSGGVVWVQVTTQVQRSKQLKDELGVTVFRWNPDGSISSRPYRVWSGGEKRRVALAVDLALSKLMASRASKAYRFLALDEVDRHLDARGRDGLRKVLEELREEKDTTLVITHDPEFRASFDRELIVTKQHGASAWEIRDGQERRERTNPRGSRGAAEEAEDGARATAQAAVVSDGTILGGPVKAGGQGQRRRRSGRGAAEVGKG